MRVFVNVRGCWWVHCLWLVLLVCLILWFLVRRMLLSIVVVWSLESMRNVRSSVVSVVLSICDCFICKLKKKEKCYSKRKICSREGLSVLSARCFWSEEMTMFLRFFTLFSFTSLVFPCSSTSQNLFVNQLRKAQRRSLKGINMEKNFCSFSPASIATPRLKRTKSREKRSKRHFKSSDWRRERQRCSPFALTSRMPKSPFSIQSLLEYLFWRIHSLLPDTR